MRAPILLLLAFLSLVLCSKKPIQTASSGEYASTSLLAQFKNVKDSMLLTIKILFNTDDGSARHAAIMGTIQTSYLGMATYDALAFRVLINPFLFHSIVDKSIMSMVNTLATLNNDSTIRLPELVYNEGFKLRLDHRMSRGIKQIAGFGLPQVVLELYLRLLKIQTVAITEMRCKDAFYAALNEKYFGKNCLDKLFVEFVAESDHKMDTKLTKFQLWEKVRYEAERNYLCDLIEFFETQKLPDLASTRFVVILARLPFVYDNVHFESEVHCRAREAAIILYHEMQPTENYLSFRARLKTPGLRQNLSEFKFSTYQGLKHSYSLLLITRHAVENHWDTYQDKVRRLVTICISFGLDYQIDNILNIASSFMKSLVVAESRPTIVKFLLLYGMSVEILRRFISPFLSDDLRKAFYGLLSFPKTLEYGFSSKMFNLFDVLESNVNSMYSKTKILSLSLFRYIEFCRSMTFFADELIKGHGKFEIYSTATCLAHYTESQDYLFKAASEDVFDLTKMTMPEAQEISKKIIDAYSLLINGKPAKSDLPVHFFQHLRSMCKRFPNERIWQNVSHGAKTEFARLEKEEQIAVKKKQIENLEASKKACESGKSRITKSVTKPAQQPGKKKRRRQFRAEAAAKLEMPEVAEDEMPVKVIGAEDSALVKTSASSTAAEDEKVINSTSSISNVEMAASLPSPFDIIEMPSLLHPMKLFKEGFSIKIPRCNRPYKRTSLSLTFKDQDPTHHTKNASLIGYEVSDIDPRDYLMVHILIGQRIWVKVMKPLFEVLEPMERKYQLIKAFNKSVDCFKSKLVKMCDTKPKKLEKVLRKAGIPNSSYLFKCLDFYQNRMLIAHPTIPSSKIEKDFFLSRHLTIFELKHVLDHFSIEKMRRRLNCHDIVQVKPIAKSGRPESLLDEDTTEIALSALWVHKAYQTSKIEFIRRKYAHFEVDDTVYHSYIDYIFRNHPDYLFLVSL